jgi:hemoglobin
MSGLTKQQINQLVINFYNKVQKDPLLGPIFNDVAKVDWEHHLPLLTNFWASVMLGTNEYHGGAYGKHVMLAQKAPISKAHFERWLELFTAEAKEILPEPYASTIVERANMIAQSLQYGMGIIT